MFGVTVVCVPCFRCLLPLFPLWLGNTPHSQSSLHRAPLPISPFSLSHKDAIMMQFSDKWMASVAGVWFLLVLFAVSRIQEIETNVGAYLEDDFTANSSQQPQLLPRTTDGEALRYVPRDVVDTWKKRDFLIVLGIPAVDVEARQRRR
ncbi:UDP-Gal or UDP-GlcNAc-dependent glycosyltransferase, partial [Trypanosoma cruzi]